MTQTKSRKYTTYRIKPCGMAAPYFYNKPKANLTRKGNQYWTYLYYRGRKIWDCNTPFFITWFEKE